MAGARTVDTGAEVRPVELWQDYGGVPVRVQMQPGSDGVPYTQHGLWVVNQPHVWTGTGWDRQREANRAVEVNTAVTAGTPVTLVTPAAGKKLRVLGVALSASAACAVLLRYGAGGTLLLRLPKAGADQPVIIERLGNGLVAGLANDPLKLDVSTSATVTGAVLYTEE